MTQLISYESSSFNKNENLLFNILYAIVLIYTCYIFIIEKEKYNKKFIDLKQNIIIEKEKREKLEDELSKLEKVLQHFILENNSEKNKTNYQLTELNQQFILEKEKTNKKQIILEKENPILIGYKSLYIQPTMYNEHYSPIKYTPLYFDKNITIENLKNAIMKETQKRVAWNSPHTNLYTIIINIESLYKFHNKHIIDICEFINYIAQIYIFKYHGDIILTSISDDNSGYLGLKHYTGDNADKKYIKQIFNMCNTHSDVFYIKPDANLYFSNFFL
jgi:hypothetical protein